MRERTKTPDRAVEEDRTRRAGSGAEAAVEWTRQRLADLDGPMPEVDLLRHAGDVRAARLRGIQDADDLNSLRRVLRDIFRAVTFQDGKLYLQVNDPAHPTRVSERVVGGDGPPIPRQAVLSNYDGLPS